MRLSKEEVKEIEDENFVRLNDSCNKFCFSFSSTITTRNSGRSVDSTFDVDGMVRLDFANGDDQANAVATQPDGKIIVCGSAFNSADHDFIMVRLNADGSLDKSFGSSGVVAANFGGEDYCRDVAVQQDGKIIAAGTAYGLSDYADFAMARYNSDGSLDFAFGSNGRVTTDFMGFADYANAMLIQQDGKIVLAGLANHDGIADFALARYKHQRFTRFNFRWRWQSSH